MGYPNGAAQLNCIKMKLDCCKGNGDAESKIDRY